VIAKFPAVDVLVNNVGIFEPKPFAEIPDATGTASSRYLIMRSAALRLSQYLRTGRYSPHRESPQMA